MEAALKLFPLLPEMEQENDLPLFINRCDILYSILTSVFEQNLLASIIVLKLHGKAQKAVSNAKATTWPEIKIVLSSIIAETVRPVEDIKAELTARIQQPDETVEKYGDELTRLLTELKTSLEREIQRKAVETFESGLRSDQLRCIVIASNSSKLSESIACATTYESQL